MLVSITFGWNFRFFFVSITFNILRTLEILKRS